MKTADLYISYEALTDLLRLYNLDIHIVAVEQSDKYTFSAKLRLEGDGLPEECVAPGKFISLSYNSQLTTSSPTVRMIEHK